MSNLKVIQSTIDLAEAIIAYKNFRKPATMTEAFYILNEEGFISDRLAGKLAMMVGFRNVIAQKKALTFYEKNLRHYRHKRF